MKFTAQTLNQKLVAQDGQAGLVAILIASIMLVIGLSVASQANREAVVSLSESEGTRTLEGAQTAVEQGLRTEISGEVDSFTTDTSGFVEVTTDDFFEVVLEAGVSLELTQVTGDLNISWGIPGVVPCDDAAILISKNQSNNAEYQAYKPNGAAGCAASGKSYDNGFASPDRGGENGLNNGLSLSVGGETIRIKALYAGTLVRLSGSAVEGTITRVIGAAANENDDQARVVEVKMAPPRVPNVMDYALYAGEGDIKK